MICLNPLKLTATGIGAALVTAGISLASETKQGKTDSPGETKTIGRVSYYLGWLVVLYSLISNEKLQLKGVGDLRSILQIIAVFIIVGTSTYKHSLIEKNEPVPKWTEVLLVVGWLILGISFGLAKGKKPFVGFAKRGRTYVGLVSALLVLLASLVIIPKDEKDQVSAGLGMSIYVIGWVILVLANSVQAPGSASSYID